MMVGLTISRTGYLLYQASLAGYRRRPPPTTGRVLKAKLASAQNYIKCLSGRGVPLSGDHPVVSQVPCNPFLRTWIILLDRYASKQLRFALLKMDCA